MGVAVEVLHEGQRFACELRDVSQSGFACEWPSDAAPEVGTVLEEAVLRFDDHEAYRGRVKVSSVRRDEKVTLIGASLIDTLMNIEDVLHLRDVKTSIAGAEFDDLAFRGAPWRVSGQERFKALVADLRLFLEDAEEKFRGLEASLPWHVTRGEQTSPARDMLIERIRGGFTREVVTASNEIDAALRSASRSEREALREYSVRHLHALLMQSWWMHRALLKPLGYPGDYEVMNAVYGDLFQGPTLFAKAINMALAWTPAAVAVRTRRDLLKAELSALLDRGGADQPLRVLSIAAGPAQEIFELLDERRELPRALEIVLFDQDKGALSYSYGRLSRLISSRFAGGVRLVHLHDSIKRLLRGSTVLGTSGRFDAIYACGLFDYLQPSTWVSLARNLYEAAAPGGTVYIGNMVPTNPSRWFMELHLDWFLEYRERAELLALARRAAPEANVRILEESTGVNPFVAMTRD